MTKSTISRERLQEIAEDGFLKHGESKVLARMALAAMDSEPVAWLAIYHGEVYDEAIGITRSVVEAQADHFGWESALTEIIPLYRHAQPAPVVQCPYPCGWDNLNKLATQDAALVARGLVEGEPTTEAQRQAAISNNDRLLKVISACRAAMIQAEPVTTANKLGNSPVIPDGYVMVPKEPTGKQWAAGVQAFDSGMDKVTRIYKAMLAAAPQEKPVNDVTAGKALTITLPDISSKAFWSGAGKNETFHPETYRRWVKEAVERGCIIASIEVEVK